MEAVEICLCSAEPTPTMRIAYLPIQWQQEAVSQGLKRPGTEGDHSAEVKISGVTPPLPHTFSKRGT
jgi:hypothetical protein